MIEIPAGADASWVAGSHGAYFGMEEFAPEDGKDELRLRHDPPLLIQVVDPAGEPVTGVAVALFESSPRDPAATVLKETLTDRSGMARLYLGDERLPEDSHYRVGLNFPLASPVEVAVDPHAPRAEPIRLLAPPTGTVRVVLVGDEAEPWPEEVHLAIHAIVPSKSDPTGVVRADQRDYRRMWGSREVLFDHVAVGIDVHLNVYVYGQSLLKDVTLNHPGPRASGEEVLIRVPFTERHAWVEGRFVREAGGEIPTGLDLLSP